MAIRQIDPEALHLFQLIGAPLLAVIQAEAQAAQVSAEFIKRIGFDAPSPPGAPASKALQDGGDIGGLKVAKFEIDRVAPDGTRAPLVVSLPVLSLFPIPLMQVKDAEFDFHIHVVSRVPLDDQPNDHDVASAPSSDFLQPDRVELKGFLANSGERDGQAVNEASIRVHVRMEQSDLPAGLMRLMTIMSENATAAPKGRS